MGALIRGWRWHRVLALAGIEHRPVDAYALVPVGYMGNTVLPARGGEVLRVVLLDQRSPARAREIFGSIVAERLLDLVVVLALLALVAGLGVGALPGGATFVALVAGAAAAAMLVLVVLRDLRRRGRLDRFARAVRPFAHASRILVGTRGTLPLATTAVLAAVDAAGFWLVARSVDLEIGFLDALFLLVLVTLVSAIPAAPGFVGTFDGALVFGLAALDAPGGHAVAYILLIRFVYFVPVTAVGALLLVVRYGGLRRPLRQAEPEEPAR